MTHIHTRTCSICEAACGLLITVEDGVATRITGDRDDPLSHGHICPKAYGLKDVQDDPDRLRSPVKRVGDTWQPIAWDVAAAEIAARLSAVQAAHGDSSVAIYRGNPVVHNLGLTLHSAALSRVLKTRANFSASTVDQIPHQLVGLWMYGHNFLIPVIDIDHAHTVLMLGANPLASNGSLWTVPGVEDRLTAMMARGGRLIVVDPRRTETARIASQHIAMQPGRDAYLLIGLLKCLGRMGRTPPPRLAALVNGWAEAMAALDGFSVDDMARACGQSVAELEALATTLAEAPVAAVYGRMGLSTQRFGTLCQWLIQLLNITLGSLDAVGGMMFNQPAADTVKLGSPGHYDRWRSRVSQRPEVLGEMPAVAMAEEMLTPGAGQVRALITLAGNPVLSTPNGRQLDRALAQLDLVVAIDPYVTETTAHAHYILPPCGPLEREHYPMPFFQLAVRRVAKYSPPVLPRPPGSLDDWEIVAKLVEALAAHKGVTAPSFPAPSAVLDQMLVASGTGVDLATLRAQPHGVDLGPLQPCLAERLRTADQRVNCAPAPMLQDLARLQAEAVDPVAGLQLIGRRHIRSNNSWLHNARRLIKGPNRCTLLIHPDDAAARHLCAGADARVTSRVGSVTLPVEISPDMARGVVSIPHGFGHGRPGLGWQVAAAHAGVSCNDLTDELRIDPVSGNAAVNGVPVEVVAA